MTSNEILKADVLDILFDDRNKQYGAYTLRKNYNNRLGIALALSLSTVLFVFFLMRVTGPSANSKQEFDKGTVTVTTVDLPKIKKPEVVIPKQTVAPPKIKETAFVNPIIKDDDKVKNPMPDQDELIKSLVSNQSKDGIDANDMPVLKETPIANTPVKEEANNTSIVAPVQREPEFPGGEDAWINFLRKNLISPEELEAGDKKMVSIRFQVSAEGVVTNFEIVQSAGKVFDNEVIRVLKKMPKWKPAIQNGQPVARAFTQPVTFVGIEQ